MRHVEGDLQGGEDLELVDGGGALAQGGLGAVAAGLAPADNHHHLAARIDGPAAPVAVLQVVQSEVHAGRAAAGHVKVAGTGGPGGEANRVELLADLVGGHVASDRYARPELDAFVAELIDPAVDQGLVQPELGNAVSQQPARRIARLEDRHVVSRADQLLCGGQPRRTGPHHGHTLAGIVRRPGGQDPALVEGALDDLAFDLPDLDGKAVDPLLAGGLAGRGADLGGELGEVVRRVQRRRRAAPVAPLGQGDPLRNRVLQRTARRLTAGHLAGHARR